VLLEREIFLFANSEIISNWIESGNRSQWSAAGADQITYLRLGNTYDAVYGGNYACETEMDAGCFDCGFAGLDLGLGSSDSRYGSLHLGFIGKVSLVCVVKILLADGICLCQRLVFLNIKLTLVLVRLSCGKQRLILNQLRSSLR
jgi:hypothetical protein